jgi:hypothetical protein
MILHIIPSVKFKCRMCTRTLKPNSCTYNFVEISGLEVSVYNVYITNQLQTTFAPVGGWGGGGEKSISRGDREEQKGILLDYIRLQSQLCPRIRPQYTHLATDQRKPVDRNLC